VKPTTVIDYFLIRTGETPWLYEMIKKHHEEAKREGIIVGEIINHFLRES